MFNMLKAIYMEDVVVVNEVIKALMAWEHMNKYYDGKYQIIILNNFNKEIYVAHNIYTDITVESGYDLINTMIDVFEQYGYDQESKDYLNEFWIPRIEQILEIQDNL